MFVMGLLAGIRKSVLSKAAFKGKLAFFKEHPEYAKNHALRNGVTASELQVIQCSPGFIHFLNSYRDSIQ